VAVAYSNDGGSTYAYASERRRWCGIRLRSQRDERALDAPDWSQKNPELLALNLVLPYCDPSSPSFAQKSAQPTIENNPPIYRWDQQRADMVVRETDG